MIDDEVKDACVGENCGLLGRLIGTVPNMQSFVANSCEFQIQAVSNEE